MPTNEATSSSRSASSLGAYVLPGGPTDPTPIIAQSQAGDRLGLGSLFIGERYSTKDLGALAGVLTQVTEHCSIVGGVTHVGTRHPMAVASMGQTLQALSGGRFVLGFGRGSAGRWKSYGLPVPTSEMLVDMASILRRLWAGETVSYDGPLGRFPNLKLMERPDMAPPPLLLAAVGPATLATAGRAYDGVMLHPFLTPGAVERSVGTIKEAADKQGRDPESIAIHATVVVAHDCDPTELVGGRGVGYLLVKGLGEALSDANGWPRSELDKLRSQPVVAGLDYNALKSLNDADRSELSRSIPSNWVSDAAATGTLAEAVTKIDDYLAAGATNILIHGTTPDQLDDFVNAYTGAN